MLNSKVNFDISIMKKFRDYAPERHSSNQSAPTFQVYQVNQIPIKIKSKIWTWKKLGAKNRVIVIQKEKRLFAPCFFQVHFLDLIFFKFQTLKNIKFTWSTRIVGKNWFLANFYVCFSLNLSPVYCYETTQLKILSVYWWQ